MPKRKLNPSRPAPQNPSPHRLDPLVEVVGNLCPDLSLAARRRVAAMAEAMRDMAMNGESCTRTDLLAAKFTPAEIDQAHPIAREALDTLAGLPLPDEAVSAFSLQDAATLRRFAAARRYQPDARAA